MADLDEAESAAGAGVVDVSFKAERKVTLKACRSLYHGVELLEDFALTNAVSLKRRNHIFLKPVEKRYKST